MAFPKHFDFAPQPGTHFASLTINRDIGNRIRTGTSIERDLRKLANKGMAYARSIAPKRSGDMANTIRVVPVTRSRDKFFISIMVGGPTAPYWVYVEYGTGQRGAGSDQLSPGIPTGFSSFGPGVGMEAQPFMRNTLWWLRNQVN